MTDSGIIVKKPQISQQLDLSNFDADRIVFDEQDLKQIEIDHGL